MSGQTGLTREREQNGSGRHTFFIANCGRVKARKWRWMWTAKHTRTVGVRVLMPPPSHVAWVTAKDPEEVRRGLTRRGAAMTITVSG